MANDIEIDLDVDTTKHAKAKAAKAAPEIHLAEPDAETVAGIVIDVTQPALVEPQQQINAAADVIPNGRDQLMQLIGQAQAFNASADLLQTFGVSQLANVKENKLYKHLAGSKSPNGLELKGTWEEFCSLIGISDETANQRIANLRSFGEAALEGMARIGVGVRDLAQYRKLPEDQRTALIAAAETGDKNQFLDLAETIIARHATEKAAMEAENNTLKEDLANSGKRANNLDAEIERLELTNERLSKQKRLTSFEPHTEDVRLECMHLQAGVELNLNSIQTLFSQVMAEPGSPERQLRIEHTYIAATVALSRAHDLVQAMQAYDLELPARIQGQHMLTPEEAERWQTDYKSLENAQAAAEAARQIKRDADRPRGRGRPSKAQGE